MTTARTSALSTAALLVLAGCLAVVAPGPVGTAFAAADGTTVSNHTVSGLDAVPIAITVFRPAGASAEAPVPVVLHSHGWSGSRTTTLSGVVQTLVRDGYGVVSVDARGHGASGGMANVHHRDVEVKDFQAVLDWIGAELDWAAADPDPCRADDRLLGAVGGSYGGGYQLMTASYDCRLDALVPQMTWNDLTYSLAPNGVVKSVWVDALYGYAKATGTRVDPRIDRWFAEVMATNEIPADAYAHFKGSSPEPQRIDADVLLMQGVPDLLFNLNEAVANYRALEANPHDRDVRLVTYLGGHVLPFQPVGFGGPARGASPCGAYDALALAWFDEKLRGVDGAADGVAEVTLALEDGSCLRLDAFPEGATAFDLGTLAVPQGAGALLVPLDVDGTVAGIGRFSAKATAPAGGAFAVGLAVQHADGRWHVVDDQATGVRVPLGCLGCAVEVDLAGVATTLAEGDRLFLRLDAANEWFATNSGRAPGAVVLEDVRAKVPTL